MGRAIHVRLDDSAEADLAIVRSEGINDSEAVRISLREAATRRRSRSALRAEVAALAADDDDRAEMRRVMLELAELAPKLP